MATAAMTLFGLITAKANKTPLPAGVAVGPDGTATTDPDAALAGALLTFGGHKGSGLSLIVELLGGVLPGAAYPGQPGGKKAAKNWGNLVLAIDPALLMEPCEFRRRATATLDHVKGSGPKVVLPGEFETARRAANLASGSLDISKALLERIRDLAAKPLSRL